MNLRELAEKYNCDKAGHGYMEHYEKFLPPNIDKMMEVGCMNGASLRMWREWYGPEPEIHTIDLFKNNEWASEEQIKEEGFITWKGDQSYTWFLNSIPHKFDVIIEDGSHRADHMIITFACMFLNHLKPGGLWVTEDLHTCKDTFFRGTVKNIDDTLLSCYKRRSSWFWLIFEDIIGRSELINDQILFIWKK